MTFDAALVALKSGSHLTRPAWNGLFIKTGDETTILYGNDPETGVGFITWQPQQGDLLASDWTIVE